MANQAITGYPSSWRAPFVAAEILLGQGPSTAAAGPREAIYVAPKTSSGSWTVNTVYSVTNEQDAITGAGAGSPLHRMIRMHLKANPRSKISALPYAASSGAGVASATGTITWATAPSAQGQTRVWVAGDRIDANFTTSSTVTTIAADIRDKINARNWLPVTASAAAGVLTLTAKIAGASQGDSTTLAIRIRADIDAGVSTTVTASGNYVGGGTGVAGADGATTEVANLTTALSKIDNARYYYMGFSVTSSTDTAIVETHVANKSAPSPGLRSAAFCGFIGTLANCSTIAIARNYERHHIVWQKFSEHTPGEIVANTIAIVQKHEEVDSAYPGFDRYRQSDWFIQAAYDRADWPSDVDENDAITDGIIPIRSDQYGSYIGMMVNTRSKDSAGTNDDFRACERHRVSVMDDFTDTVLLQHNNQFTSVGFKIKDDKRNADGSVDVNQKLPPKVITPSTYRPWLAARIQAFEDAGKFQDAAYWKESMRVNIDPQNVSRLEVGASGRTIDVWHQTTYKLSETTPG